MNLKSEMHCPMSIMRGHKVTVESEKERLDRREQRKTTREFKGKMAQGFVKGAEAMNEVMFEGLQITTGDDVSHIVWSEETLAEFQKFIDEIKKEEQESLRDSLELDGIKCTDSQWEQIEDASIHLGICREGD